MSTTQEDKEYILESLSLLDGITCRPMMGEYLLYCGGVLFGGIYDGRLLVKIVEGNKKYNLSEQIPYKNAKLMYQIEDLDDRAKVKEIVLVTCQDLPVKKK